MDASRADEVVEERPGAEPSRRRFLQLSAPVAAGGLAALLAACGTSEDEGEGKATGGRDIAIVNYALTLEYLESDFYDKVVGAGIFSGAVGDLFKLIQGNEREHVAALEATVKKLGGRPAERPRTRFPLGGGPKEVLRLAATLENTGAAAYLGQADQIENRDVLSAALSIHTIEARHAAKLNRLVGRPFTPDGPFAAAMTMREVALAIEPFIA